MINPSRCLFQMVTTAVAAGMVLADTLSKHLALVVTSSFAIRDHT